MKANWENLFTVLGEMTGLYRDILDLSRKKRDVLIAVKPQDLEAITKNEEVLILQVGKLEAARGKIMQEIASAGKIDVDTLTLTKLKELAGPDEAKRLAAVTAELAGIMADLAPVNQINAELIQQALGFINYNLNLLTQNTAGTTYAPRGTGQQEPQMRKLVDKKI